MTTTEKDATATNGAHTSTAEETGDQAAHPGEQHCNVTEALAAVMGELPGIAKEGRADPAQGGYSYRGIEQITRHAQGILAKHGVVPFPRVLETTITPITVNSKPWTDTMLKVEYRFRHGPSDTEEIVGPLIGIGRDNSDKGANKAMTQVFKYALIQVLCIGDSKDDADGTSTEADAPGPPWWEPLGYADEDQAKATNDGLKAVFDGIDRSGHQPIKDWLKANGYHIWLPVSLEHAPEYGELLKAQRAAHPITAIEPTAGEGAATPEGSQELPAPQAAPDSAPGPETPTAAATAPPPAQPAIPTTPDVDVVKDITDNVKAMTEAEIDAALVRRGKKADGKMPAKQRQLAAIMVQEKAEATTTAQR